MLPLRFGGGILPHKLSSFRSDCLGEMLWFNEPNNNERIWGAIFFYGLSLVIAASLASKVDPARVTRCS